MTENGADFTLECGKASLVAFHGLGVILKADAALVGKNDYCIARRDQWSAGSRDLLLAVKASFFTLHTHLRIVS